MKRKRKESYAAMTGTPRHKKRKEAMKIFSQAQHTNITGTPEHEKRNEAMRNRKQDLRAKIAASPSLKKSDFRKNIKKIKRGDSKWALFYLRCL